MILDTLAHHACYRSLGAGIAHGFDWLADLPAALPDGRYDLAGNDVFALVQSYSTVAPREKPYEAHRKYLDLQYVFSGREVVCHAPVAGLPPQADYIAEKDYQLYGEPAEATLLHLPAGSFAIFSSKMLSWLIAMTPRRQPVQPKYFE